MKVLAPLCVIARVIPKQCGMLRMFQGEYDVSLDPCILTNVKAKKTSR